MPPEVSVCWVGGGGRREVQQCGGSSVHPAADLQRDRFTQQHSTEAGLPGTTETRRARVDQRPLDRPRTRHTA